MMEILVMKAQEMLQLLIPQKRRKRRRVSHFWIKTFPIIIWVFLHKILSINTDTFCNNIHDISTHNKTSSIPLLNIV